MQKRLVSLLRTDEACRVDAFWLDLSKTTYERQSLGKRNQLQAEFEPPKVYANLLPESKFGGLDSLFSEMPIRIYSPVHWNCRNHVIEINSS
jgi:hypothetical protein